MTKTIRVLLVEPMKKPRLVTVEHTLEELQKLVGGYIEVTYPWEDEVGLISCDDAKFNGSAPNRCLEDYDVIYGTFFLAGLTDDNFGDISDELAEKFAKKFAYPEIFLRTAENKVVCVKLGSPERPHAIF